MPEGILLIIRLFTLKDEFMRLTTLKTICSIGTLSLLVTTQVFASPQYGGRWGSVFNWPFPSSHVILTPQGNILTVGQVASLSEVLLNVWNPELGTQSNSHNTFRSLFPSGARSTSGSTILLPESGNVLITGTQFAMAEAVQTFIFNTEANSLSRSADMQANPRVYSVSTILPSGEILVSGEARTVNNPERFPEIYSPITNEWRYLSGVSLATVPYKNTSDMTQWVTPSGKVFGYGGSGLSVLGRKNIFTMNTQGEGSLSSSQNVFSLGQGDSVMYRPGKIFSPQGDILLQTPPFIVDVSGNTPYVRPVTAPRTNDVIFTYNPMMLPNGKVMALSQLSNDFGFKKFLEVWDPASESWGAMAKLDEKNELSLLNNAVLLKDGTILVLGYGEGLTPKASIYSPPYLFNSSDQLAERPTILSAPAKAAYGREVTVKHESVSPISRVTLIKTSRVERGKSVGSRFIELAFDDIADGVSVKLPESANAAPPGHYVMYLLDNKGVPSSGHIIRIFESAKKDTAYPTATTDNIDLIATDSHITIDALANDLGVGLTLIAPNIWSLKGGNVALVDNKLSYKPKAGFSGEDKIWYVFSDFQGRTNSGQINITVKSNNFSAFPIAYADTYATLKNTPRTLDILNNDTASSSISIKKLYAYTAKGGTSYKTPEGKVWYTPKADFVGEDNFWYVMIDTQGRKNSAQVKIYVTP